MLYSEYISKAKSICIAIHEDTDVAYLVPDYRYILSLSGLDLSEVTDFPDVNMNVVAENLRLEVDTYNIRKSKVKQLVDKVDNFLSVSTDVILNSEENEIFKNLIDKFKANEEDKTNADNKVISLPKYINLRKKEI